jgi:uncharacterized protein
MRAVLTTTAVLAGIWLVLVLAAWGLQRQLIYLPTAAEPAPPRHVEEVTLPTDDGLELSAWYLTPEEQPLATVMVLPGNAGDRSLRLPLADGLVARGHAVLLVDYRGYGGNPGSPDEAGLHRDALAARQHLLARDDVDADRLVYLGESLGSGVAAALAAEHPPAALVLRSPFGELADVGRAHYPILPVRLLLWDRFETRQHLADHDGPVLVVAGGADAIVPTELSVEVARAVDADYRELDGVDHNDRELLDGEDYLDAVDEFLHARLGAP